MCLYHMAAGHLKHDSPYSHLHVCFLLQVEGLGQLQWPLTAAQADQLKPLCQQAPHGRGEATVIDTTVRNTLQLSPGKFSIAQTSSWLTTLGKIVGDAQKELGVPGDVEAQLYKMLLYEKGSFFVPHRDTEKVGQNAMPICYDHACITASLTRTGLSRASSSLPALSCHMRIAV
jgi:hypothetical protein